MKKKMWWIGALAAAMMALAPLSALAAEGLSDADAAAAAKKIDPIAASDSSALAAELGVLKGDGSGVTDAYLTQGTTRLQAATLYLRLLGREKEALGYAGAASFADAASVGSAGQHVLAYLKAHPELGWIGGGDGAFAPNAAVTSQELYKVLLESLGYSATADFAYKDTLAFAASAGLHRAAAASPFANRDLAVALVEALQAKPKGAADTLAAKLAAEGVIAPAKLAALTGARLDLAKTADGGEYWTDGSGRALYLFTKDTASLEACQDACLASWPVFAADRLLLPEGVAAADFGVHARADGTKQVTYKGWPLYYFVKDAKPGDTFGEGVGGVWFLIRQPFYSVGLGTDAALGNYLTDANGRTLYYFDKDTPGQSACSGQCLANWPVFHADKPVVPSGLNAADFGEITRDDGTKMTTFKGYPLYYFVKDAERGDLYGQGVGDVWYVVDPAKFAGTTAAAAGTQP